MKNKSKMIDYTKIARAMNFYEEQKFLPLETPWLASLEATQATCPVGKRDFNTFAGSLVASGEQSFIELQLQKQIKPGKYVTCTPCFRDDIFDTYHHVWFLKVELIKILKTSKEYNKTEKEKEISAMVKYANEFFQQYTKTTLEKKENLQIDIIDASTGIELGSYGYRYYKNNNWIYGTGLAEPRLSQVLHTQEKSYHQKDIPKAKFGTMQKIEEEFLELYDAHYQKNKILELVELADLYGAIKGYVNKNYKNISFKQIINFAKLTEKAFTSGKRS